MVGFDFAFSFNPIRCDCSLNQVFGSGFNGFSFKHFNEYSADDFSFFFRIVKSSTVYIRNEQGGVDGVFCVNYDITNLLMAQKAVGSLLSHGEEPKAPASIPQNVNELLDELIEQSVQKVGKPVALMTKDDKIAAIRFLNKAGAFLVTKSGDKVSKYFGISKYTLYSYIDASKNL